METKAVEKQVNILKKFSFQKLKYAMEETEDVKNTVKENKYHTIYIHFLNHILKESSD